MRAFREFREWRRRRSALRRAGDAGHLFDGAASVRAEFVRYTPDGHLVVRITEDRGMWRNRDVVTVDPLEMSWDAEEAAK